MKEKEKRIQTLFDRFNADGISFNEYLGAIKHLIGLQVWSYGSATEMLCEGEGEEDTDSF